MSRGWPEKRYQVNDLLSFFQVNARKIWKNNISMLWWGIRILRSLVGELPKIGWEPQHYGEKGEAWYHKTCQELFSGWLVAWQVLWGVLFSVVFNYNIFHSLFIYNAAMCLKICIRYIQASENPFAKVSSSYLQKCRICNFFLLSFSSNKIADSR